MGGQDMTEAAVPDGTVDTDYDPTRSPHREDPFRFYDWSQRSRPVIWNEAIGAWLLTRYEDIERVTGDPATFSSSVAAPPLDKILPPDVLAVLAQAGPPGMHMVQADPPRHEVMKQMGRAVVNGARINASARYMRQTADELIDSFVGNGRVELVSEFALPYVHRVLSTLVGIPDSEMSVVDVWNNAFLGLMSPLAGHDEKLALARLYLEYEDYLRALIEDRRRAPREDLVSDLVRVYDERGIAADEALPDMKMFIRGLYAGGIHTTADGIDSSVHLMLTTDGGEPWRSAVADPAAIPAVWEEVMRLEAPHRGLTRLALQDTRIGDVDIKAGEQVLLLFGAANRDPDVFPVPAEFRPGRDNILRHMAFGHGIHQCLGRPLARREAHEALTALTRRLPSLTLAPDYQPDYSPAFYFRGLQSLHLAWT
jgi:cytochrome P450